MKKIILALIVLVVTGCSVNYNVKINDDFTINEKVEIKEDDKFYEQYYRTTRKNALNGILDNYSNILKNNNYRYKGFRGGKLGGLGELGVRNTTEPGDDGSWAGEAMIKGVVLENS